jgi:hypothetical protein
LLPLRDTHTHTHTHTLTHTQYFALETTQAHTRSRPKNYTILQRSIQSSETQLNDDTLGVTATRQLTPRVLEQHILDIHNGNF